MFKWFKKIYEPKFKVGDIIRPNYIELLTDYDIVITKIGKRNYAYHFINDSMIFEDSIAIKDSLYEKVK